MFTWCKFHQLPVLGDLGSAIGVFKDYILITNHGPKMNIRKNERADQHVFILENFPIGTITDSNRMSFAQPHLR